MLKRIVVLFTLTVFMFVTSGCATTGHQSTTANSVQESSDSIDKPKTIALVAGVVVVGTVLVFALANLAAKGIGQNIGGSVA